MTTFTLAPARTAPLTGLVIALRCLGYRCRPAGATHPNRTRCSLPDNALLSPRFAWRAALRLARFARCPIITRKPA